MKIFDEHFFTFRVQKYLSNLDFVFVSKCWICMPGHVYNTARKGLLFINQSIIQTYVLMRKKQGYLELRAPFSSNKPIFFLLIYPILNTFEKNNKTSNFLRFSCFYWLISKIFFQNRNYFQFWSLVHNQLL